MSLQTWITRNPVPTAIVLGIGVSLLFNSSNMAKNAQTLGDLRDRVQTNNAVNMQLQADQQHQQAAAQIANQRYQSGCVFVFSSNSTALTTVTPDQPVIDSARGVPLPAGQTVCDVYGGTAILALNAQGVPVASAFTATGDRTVIDAAMQKAGIR